MAGRSRRAGHDAPAPTAGDHRERDRAAAADPIELQVITGALRAACEEMGAALVRSAHSPNIKERRDCSTALFDARGRDGRCRPSTSPCTSARCLTRSPPCSARTTAAGLPWVLNDPFAGGTHLPDITVVTPVFAAAERGALLGFAASRAHHADVGGRVPGSMPADSRTLEEEGVVISPGPLTPAAIEELVASMRQPAERRADLRAQLAANRIGALRLAELARRARSSAADAACARRSTPCSTTPSGAPAPASPRSPTGPAARRTCWRRSRATSCCACAPRARASGCTSTSPAAPPQHSGNLNCPLAVTRSACYFAVRVLTDPDIPPSAGAYRPVEVRVPEGSLLNALPAGHGAPAVAAGNVETSSRVADLVLAAFGRALGQGTMNNLTLGDERFSYYETLGGGQGACADADGPSGVHVAMSNTLNTPVEALEREFPLRVTRYALRRGSGGAGAHRGGDGVVREIEALREMTFSLITERRRHPPPGAHGGEPGARGRNLLDGRELPGKVTGVLRPGERLRIETPGGGGYGPHLPGDSHGLHARPRRKVSTDQAPSTGPKRPST